MRINKLRGTLGVLLVCVLVMTGGCKNDDEGGGGTISTLSAPSMGDIGNTPLDNASPVFTRNDAESVFTGVSNAISSLRTILSDADEKAFEDAFAASNGGMPSMNWFNQKQYDSSASYSVNINNTYALGLQSQTNLSGTIKGTEKASISLNNGQTIGGYIGYGYYDGGLRSPGDKVSSSSSSSRTFELAKFGYVSFGSNSNYKMTGIIKTEYSSSGSQTFKEYNTNADKVFTGSSSSVSKVSAALLISNGSNVTRLRFSFARESSGNTRSIDNSSSYNYSDIEVYNVYTNDRITTIPAGDVTSAISSWLGLASAFSQGAF